MSTTKLIYEPIVTIYILNHNYSKYFKDAFNSVINQTYDRLDIIVIDDGSTDDSVEIISSLTEIHPSIRFVTQTNKGLTASINIAIKLAKGKYIMRLDADDYLDPNAVSEMVNKIEKMNEVGLIFTDYYVVNESKEIINHHQRFDFDNEVQVLDNPAHGACTMFKLDVLKEFGGYNESYKMQDGYYIWLKIIQKYKVTNLNKPLFYYRQHEDSLSKRKTELLSNRIKIKKDAFRDLNLKHEDILAVIPLNSNTEDEKTANLIIDGKTLIDYKIEILIKIKAIKYIVVATSNEKLINYLEDKYQKSINIIVFYRDYFDQIIGYNLFSLYSKILDYLNNEYNFFPISIITANISYPFLKESHLDDLIITQSIFNTDSVVSVVEENSSIYKYSGKGLIPIKEQFTPLKLERELLYRSAGGISIILTKKMLELKKTLGGVIGHILLDDLTSKKLDLNSINENIYTLLREYL